MPTFADLREKVRRRRLKQREKAFALAYLGPAKLNGIEAARLSGYRGTDPSLSARASRLLARAPVQRFVGQALAKRALSKMEILGELSEIAVAPWRDFLTFEVVEGVPVNVKLNLANKVKALEILARVRHMDRDPLMVRIEELVGRELDRIARKGRQELVSAHEVDSLPPALLPAPQAGESVIDAELVPAAPSKVVPISRRRRGAAPLPPFIRPGRLGRARRPPPRKTKG